MNIQTIVFDVCVNNQILTCHFEYNGQESETSLISVGDFWLYTQGKAALNQQLNQQLNANQSQDWYAFIKNEANDYMDIHGYEDNYDEECWA